MVVPALIPLPTTSCSHRILQLGRESVVDAVLHKDAVGTDAGLATVAEFRDHDAGHSPVEIGVGEDDERRVPAQLQRYFLDRARALLRAIAGPLQSNR